MTKTPINTMPPSSNVLLATSQPPRSYRSLSIRELEAHDGSLEDHALSVDRQRATKVAKQLGSVQPLRHRFTESDEYRKISEHVRKSRAFVRGAKSAGVTFFGSNLFSVISFYAMGIPVFSFSPGVVLTAAFLQLCFLPLSAKLGSSVAADFQLFPATCKNLLENPRGTICWTDLVENSLFTVSESRIQHILHKHGISEKQLLKERRPITKNGIALNGNDIHEMFAGREGVYRPDALADFARMMWSARAAGKLKLSSRNFEGAADWFNRFAGAMTGREPRDIDPTVTLASEFTTPFLTLVRDCSYYGKTLPLSIAASSAYIMRYYIDTCREDNAWRMLESLKNYLAGNYETAFLNHIEALETLPAEEDASIEDIGVRSIHHRVIARLICERMQTMEEPNEELSRYAEENAATATAGLQELAQEGDHVYDIVGLGSLLSNEG